jgi:RimJ/RimL family protein N-acetyltransferase
MQSYLVSADEDWPVLTGGGLVLRVLRSDDAVGWKAGEDEEQRRWFAMPGPAPIANVVAAVERWRANWRDDGPVRHWGIWIGGRLSGGVEIRVRDDQKANVSYIVFPEARGRGVGALAVGLAADWAFRNLEVRAIVAVINPENAASVAVARSAGFEEDGWAEAWEYGETGPMVRYVLAPGEGVG